MLLGVTPATSEFARRLGSLEVKRSTTVQCDAVRAREDFFAAQ
jgi:hypothetical protein